MDQPPQSTQAQPTRYLRVLVGADNALARAGLAVLLADQAEIDIVGQSALADEIEPAVDLHRPDVVVCDLGYDPLDAVEWLNEQSPDGPAFVGLVADSATATEALPSLIEAGVRGLLLQTTRVDAMAAAIRAVGHGMIVVGPDIAWSRAAARPPATPEGVGEPFTRREREVLALLAEGMPNKLIARQLQISEHTVKFHINGLLTKLGVASRTEAVVRATRLGLIAL